MVLNSGMPLSLSLQQPWEVDFFTFFFDELYSSRWGRGTEDKIRSTHSLTVEYLKSDLPIMSYFHRLNFISLGYLEN